ncbi:Os01g0272850, partial [Oryza sativa Japonica Group]
MAMLVSASSRVSLPTCFANPSLAALACSVDTPAPSSESCSTIRAGRPPPPPSPDASPPAQARKAEDDEEEALPRRHRPRRCRGGTGEGEQGEGTQTAAQLMAP